MHVHLYNMKKRCSFFIKMSKNKCKTARETNEVGK